MSSEFVQLMIACTGMTALALTQLPVPKKYVKFAPILGLAGQPFWFISAYTAQQWGIFLMCTMYTTIWAIGFYRFWLANDKAGLKEFLKK